MKKLFKYIIVPLLFAAVTFSIIYFGWIDKIDSGVQDILYHRAGGTSPDIKIVKIDDRSISELGSYEEWDRGMYARLIDALTADGCKPAVIAFDMLFDSYKDLETDKQFAESCKRHGNVVTAFSYVFQREVTSDENGELTVSNLSVADVIKPYDELYNVTKHGFANALMDNKDGLIRSSFLYYPPEPQPGEVLEFSLNAEIAKAYAGAMGIPLELPYDLEQSAFSFRYSGKIGGYEAVSFSDVLNGEIPAQAFDNCIVLVGAYAQGMMDQYYVPVDRSAQMFGVEIHANAVQAILEGKTLTRLPHLISALIGAALAAIAAALCGRLTPLRSVVLCVVMIVAKLAAGFIMFNVFGYSSETIISPALIAVAAVYGVIGHYYSARRSKREIERAFKKYVAPQVVSKIAKSGTYELKLGGETRDIAVMFVDIRGFTPLSESLEPQQVVEILNSYLKLTTTCIFAHEGTLDKFVGDAAMAVWNAPFDTDDYVLKAVLTAWDIARGGDEIERECVEKFGKHVGFGVGVNCGKAVVGNIGCDFRMDYTAIGDTVNTAARLEANAPRGKVYISSEVYERIKDRITVEDIGEIPLKGKSNGVFVYSVTGIKEGTGEQTNETVAGDPKDQRIEQES